MESVWSVSKLSTESVGSRRDLVANCVHTADATKQFRRVGGVYWALQFNFMDPDWATLFSYGGAVPRGPTAGANLPQAAIWIFF